MAVFHLSAASIIVFATWTDALGAPARHVLAVSSYNIQSSLDIGDAIAAESLALAAS